MMLNTTAFTQIASSSATATWDGPAQLTNARGEFTSDSRQWIATGDNALIDGSFTAALVPIGSDKIHMEFQGEMRTTTLASNVQVGAPAGRAAWLFLGGLAIAAAGTTALIQIKRSGRVVAPTTLRAGDLTALAEQAADGDDFARAADFAELARRQSPSSRRLAIDHAYYLSRIGERERALRILASDPAGNDPDALMLTARLRIEAGENDEAARALIRALAEAPIIVLDVEGDEEFTSLMARNEVRAAIRKARRALD